MIKLTLHNSIEILINVDSIEKIELADPTAITLNNGKIIHVLESPLFVTNTIKDYESVKKFSLNDRQKQE